MGYHGNERHNHHHEHRHDNRENNRGNPNRYEKRNPKDYPNRPAPERLPPDKRGFVEKIKSKFSQQERAPTPSELEELKLNAQREKFRADYEVNKTRGAKAKKERPSRWTSMLSMESPQQNSGGGRRGRSRSRQPSGGGMGMGMGMMGNGLMFNSVSFRGSDSMLGVGGNGLGFGGGKKKSGMDMGFGKGAQDMLSF